MHPNEALVRSVYEAQSRGDMDAYVSHLTDDFVIHIPGRSRIAGDYRGEAEVRRHFREIRELSGGTFQTSLHDLVAGDDHVVALVEATAERDGQVVSLPRTHVWHVRDGRLAELWLQPMDQHAFDAFWGSSTEADPPA
jgi:ketosteroid isomerase-like protein